MHLILLLLKKCADYRQARKTVKQRCVEILAAAKPPVLRLVFQAIIQRLVDARKEKERKIAERKERFQELLEEYYYRGDHVTVTWEKVCGSLFMLPFRAAATQPCARSCLFTGVAL